jgi:hypothetical protein
MKYWNCTVGQAIVVCGLSSANPAQQQTTKYDRPHHH